MNKVTINVLSILGVKIKPVTVRKEEILVDASVIPDLIVYAKALNDGLFSEDIPIINDPSGPPIFTGVVIPNEIVYMSFRPFEEIKNEITQILIKHEQSYN